jgi:HAD superfamily hydrolase (TIGR01490 family)
LSLAIFDLDNTLLGGDSDYLWGQYLAEAGVVDKESYESQNRAFYEQYKAGTLDIYEFAAFSFRPLSEHSMPQLYEWRANFIEQKIRPLLLDKAFALVDKHRNDGDTLLIITATNRFVTEPIAELYGIENLLATDPEMEEGRFTGKVAGIPCFQDGKVKRLRTWMESRDASLKDSWFYSDSNNDLPLLQKVDNPVAVDPDPALKQYAEDAGWPVMSLR